MRSRYTIKIPNTQPFHYAECEVQRVSTDTFRLKDIYVSLPARGSGVATQVLLQVLADADNEGIELLFKFREKPYPTPLSTADLELWLSRYGFEKQDSVWVRRPRED